MSGYRDREQKKNNNNKGKIVCLLTTLSLHPFQKIKTEWMDAFGDFKIRIEWMYLVIK